MCLIIQGRNILLLFVNTRHYNSIDEALAEIKNDLLLFVPGEKFHYSGDGYTILSAAIEAVYKRDFLTAMDELVFTPLKMTNTCADLPTASNVTLFYDNYSKKGRMAEIATF